MSTYVYGIVRRTPTVDPSTLTGVGAPPAKVRLIEEGDLSAAVSTTSEDLLPKRRDLAAHQDVLMRLGERGPVLPMRFGALAPDDEAVATELHDNASRYTELLDRLEGCFEFNVKVSHVEEEALRVVLTEDEGLRAANERLRAMGGGGPDERMAFGERVSHALEDLREHHASALLPVLTASAEEVVTGSPVEGYLANVSLLVRQERAQEVLETVEELRRTMGRLMEFHLNGPLPPYSFVETEEREHA
ncbi:GvpL/GvpF family gas vesicle protein [Nocardiopsis alkaliphila]|uniref:GvpL/GvpF family gas vesicle protein n=1 Tax=Nocardiopsis alkaliphila TaxID=225762 RepID=UPI00034BADEA|nr:GvpL/GvpF family gas vesicle protein [Nocardiopsis alkaliphila]